MTKKKRSLNRLIIILLIIAAATYFLVHHFHINDFRVIEPAVLYTSGQPRGMDYPRLLYKYHIATIVSVRSPSEHKDQNWHTEEITWTRNNGVKYIEMPIKKNSYFPDEQTQNNFIAIMANKDNLPVLLHGGRKDKRVAMLVAVWLRKSQGYTAEHTAETIKKIIEDRQLTEDEITFINHLAG
jgi:protein tyrosine/serine phosphatase